MTTYYATSDEPGNRTVLKSAETAKTHHKNRQAKIDNALLALADLPIDVQQQLLQKNVKK